MLLAGCSSNLCVPGATDFSLGGEQENSAGPSGEFKQVKCNYLFWDMMGMLVLNPSLVKSAVGFLTTASQRTFYFSSPRTKPLLAECLLPITAMLV